MDAKVKELIASRDDLLEQRDQINQTLKRMGEELEKYALEELDAAGINDVEWLLIADEFDLNRYGNMVTHDMEMNKKIAQIMKKYGLLVVALDAGVLLYPSEGYGTITKINFSYNSNQKKFFEKRKMNVKIPNLEQRYRELEELRKTILNG